MLSHLYDRFVQVLYNYGMHAHQDHELIKDILEKVFNEMQTEGELCLTESTIRFCLFKKFRNLVVSHCISSGRAGDIFTPRENDPLGKNTIYSHLTKDQREAIFLKINCGFSYHEVAAIMDIDTESAYKLISTAIELVRRSTPLPVQSNRERTERNTFKFNWR
jgi:hypothetical protein